MVWHNGKNFDFGLKATVKILNKILLVSIFLFSSVNAFGAVKQFVDKKAILDADDPLQREPTGVIFSPDGKKMYVTGINMLGVIVQYNLTTAFDVSTSSLQSGSCTPSTHAGSVQTMNIRFNSDGTKFFLLNTTKNIEGIDTYNLTTPYDISTCSYVTGSSQGFGGEPVEFRDFAFSRDGKKVFLFDQTGTYSIKEYSLTGAFDLSNPTLSATYDRGGSLNNINTFSQGMTFSFDGSRMFLTGSKELGGMGQDVQQFTLSSPFDLSKPVTYDGKINVTTQIEKLSGIAFSSNGMKMFLTDWANDEDQRGVYEYDLTCSFGPVKCINPSKNKDDVATIESQSESAKKLMKNNLNPVLNRMEWIRRNNKRLNLTNQNIKFQFNNEILNSLSKTLIPIYFSNDKTSKINPYNSNWSFWSEGTVSIGKIEESVNSSTKDINTSAITFGADRKNDKNIMRGIALRLGNDDIDVGNIGSALDMKSISFTFYETRPKGDNKFLDSLIGISFLNSELINSNGPSSTTGERDGQQIFGSLNFRNTFNGDKLNVTPKMKLDLGATRFSGYSEKGAEGLTLKFEDQYIGNVISSIGTSIDKEYVFENNSLIPYFDFEYSADLSPSSEQNFSNISTGDKFSFKGIDNPTQSFQTGIGFDFIHENGFNLMSKFTRDQAENGNHNDSFFIALDYQFSHNSSYAMSFQNNSTRLTHQSEVNGFYVDIDSHYEFFSDYPQYGVYLKISNQR